MLEKRNFALIGHIGKTHGVSGEVASRLDVDLVSLSAEEDDLFVMLEDNGLLIPYRILSCRAKANDIDLLTFDGVTTKEQAERLTGRAVWLSRDYMEDDGGDGGITSYTDCIGYTVRDYDTQAEVGTISDVDESTLNAFLYLEAMTGEELILPIADELIASIDTTRKELILHIPIGLLDGDAVYDDHD